MNQAILPSKMLVPGSDFNQYVSKISEIPVLSLEEEEILTKRLFNDDCIESARMLVISHLRFVVHIAKSYAGYNQSVSDLVQQGNLGLMKAVKKFNPNYGFRLTTFAIHWIKAEILEFIIQNYRSVKVFTTKAQRKLFFNYRSLKGMKKNLEEDEALKIAKELNVKVSDVYDMEERMYAYDVSFDLPTLTDNSESDAIYSPSEYLSNKGEDPADLYLADEEKEARVKILSLVRTLDERSRDIIESRWMNDNKSTLEDLSQKYGVSRERIRQLESNAIKKIRNLTAETQH